MPQYVRRTFHGKGNGTHPKKIKQSSERHKSASSDQKKVGPNQDAKPPEEENNNKNENNHAFKELTYT